MPPKTKFKKEDIINATIELVRQNGADAINARTIAMHLSCSTQPIFSNFSSIDELKREVIKRAELMSDEYIQREIQNEVFPKYKASGIAYIRFAKEERELFKLLYMRDRSSEDQAKKNAQFTKMQGVVHNNTGLSYDASSIFHLEMWAFVHGIATMHATGFLELDWDTISQMLSDSYLGLKKQYGVE